MLQKNDKKLLLILLVSFLLSCTKCYCEVSRKPLIIAVLPCYDVVMSFRKFHPLITYLKNKTGLNIESVIPKSFEEFEWALRNKDIDFVFQDPHTYVYLDSLYNKDSLITALSQDGKNYQYGLIITRKDSGIKKVVDLRGKKVMFGPKFSATKWIAAKEVFKRNGINIDTDLKAYFNGGCCEDIAFNVYMKAVDAGVVCDHFLNEPSEGQNELGTDIKQIKAIAKTGQVQSRVFAARKDLEIGVVTKINQALLDLDISNPEHASIMYSAETTGFKKAADKDYDTMRSLIGVKISK